jgi:hypothetical protein
MEYLGMFFLLIIFFFLQIKIRIMNSQQSNSSHGNSPAQDQNNNTQRALADIILETRDIQQRQQLPYLADPLDSWYEDPTITEDARRIRKRARNYRQYHAYLQDPVNFNRQEWRREDEATMRARYQNPQFPYRQQQQHQQPFLPQQPFLQPQQNKNQNSSAMP